MVKGMVRLSLLLVVTAVLAVLSYSQPAEREKVEEGRYARIRDGQLVPDTEQSWVLWRLPDNQHELEDHFQPNFNPAAALVADVAAASPKGKSRIGPELMGDLKKEVAPTDITVRYSADWQPVAITVRGKRLTKNETVDILKCEADSKKVRCSGVQGKAQLSLREPRALLYAYPFPMFFRSWIAPPQEHQAGENLRKIVLVVPHDDKLVLDKADLIVSALGPETFTLGGKQFYGLKFKLDFHAEHEKTPRLIAWTDQNGFILAVEIADEPGNMVALLEYQSHSSQVPAAAQQDK